MKKIIKILAITLIFLSIQRVSAHDWDTVVDIAAQNRSDFISITSKFNQGNTKNSYEEYSELIERIKDDTILLNLSKVFSEIGLFSLANKASGRISNRGDYAINIKDIETSYRPKSALSVEDEIFFAKQYASIYFDNSADDAIDELLSKKKQYKKNDYYHYILAQAYLNQRLYSKALRQVNKAFSLNNTNLSYKLLKADILSQMGKNKNALSIIEKVENNKRIIELASDIQIKKAGYQALSNNERDKKYYIAKKSFLEGNYEKAKNECRSFLNFDKDNDSLIALYAKSELALGNVEQAGIYFQNAAKIDKNNLDTLIGLGDISYNKKDYANAVKYYNKALSKDKNNFEIVLKLQNALREDGQNQKELIKIETLYDKLNENTAIEYYRSAISIAQKSPVLKEDFLKRALENNPMYNDAKGALVELYLKNKNFREAKKLINDTAFTLEKNYYYYYLCALYYQAQGRTRDAIQSYKTCLSLNPNFETANKKLLNLIPEKQEYFEEQEEI